METYGYIYITTNNENGKTYIGQKKSPIFIPTYFGSGKYLKNALNKYRKENFSISILDWAKDKKELDNLEIKYISYYKESGLGAEYNIAPGGTGSQLSGKDSPLYGKHPSDETRIRLRISHLGKKQSKETKEKRAEKHIGRKCTEETKRKMSESRKGWNPSEKTRINMSIAQTGKKHSEEHKKNISKSNKGRIFSEKHKKHLSESKKLYYQNKKEVA